MRPVSGLATACTQAAMRRPSRLRLPLGVVLMRVLIFFSPDSRPLLDRCI